MAWYWQAAIVLQILADIFFFVFIVLLVLAQGTLTNKIKIIAETMLQTALLTDTRLSWTNNNVKNVAKFLVGVFGLDAPAIKEEPPVTPTDPSNFKN